MCRNINPLELDLPTIGFNKSDKYSGLFMSDADYNFFDGNIKKIGITVVTISKGNQVRLYSVLKEEYRTSSVNTIFEGFVEDIDHLTIIMRSWEPYRIK